MNLKGLLHVVSLFLVCTFLKAQPQLALQPFASGFETPISIAAAGDDRLFVVEQRGLIKSINAEGTVSGTPFLDLSGVVSQSGSETGLLGLAFHPEYAANGYFFVNYTRQSDGNTVISRFSRDESNPDLSDPGSEVQLFTVEQPADNHNGGQLLFGPDGYLYISLGDGGGAGDPGNNAQNRGSLLGKMLRIDINVDEAPYYAIPDDNPFVDDNATLDEIWALGLRNPWRSSFDRYTGDLWIADVGQSEREEINFQSASESGGANYGWRCYEGDVAYNLNDCQDEGHYTFPVFDFEHQGSGCSGSVTGGYVYRGALYNGMSGHYIFADYCTGVFYHVLNSDTGFEGKALGTFSRYEYTAFAEDQYGELYVTLKGEGEVRKVVETGDCKPVAKIVEMDFPVELEPGESITLEAFFHPSLEYQWYKNGSPQPGETEHTIEVSEEATFSVTVTNPANACTNTSDPMEVTLVYSSVSTLETSSLKIYPNPAGHQLHIEGLPLTGKTTVSLIDENGVSVLTEISNNSEAAILSTQKLPVGMYVLRINHENNVVREKIMINNE